MIDTRWFVRIKLETNVGMKLVMDTSNPKLMLHKSYENSFQGNANRIKRNKKL